MISMRRVLSSLPVSLALVACSSFESSATPSADAGPGAADGDAGLDVLADGGSEALGITLTFTDASKPAYLVQGANVEVPFQIARKPGSKGPVTVSVTAGLPANVAAVPFTVPDGESVGRLLLRSDTSAVQGLVTVDVEAVESVPNGARAEAKRAVFVRGKAGTLDTTFGDKGLVPSLWKAPYTGAAHDAAVNEDGSVLVTGYRANPNGVSTLIKLDPSGAKDTPSRAVRSFPWAARRWQPPWSCTRRRPR
jgi:hypothetical protein